MEINKEVQKKVYDTLFKYLDDTKIEEFNDDAQLELLGLNSMSFVSFILDLEEILGFNFPDDFLTINKITTINKLYAVLYTVDRN